MPDTAIESPDRRAADRSVATASRNGVGEALTPQLPITPASSCQTCLFFVPNCHMEYFLNTPQHRTVTFLQPMKIL